MKRIMTILMAVGIVGCLTIFTTACAKKHIKTEEQVKSPEVITTARPVEEKKAVDEEALKRTESERLAKLREQEREQKLRAEIQEFELKPIYFDFDKSVLRPEAQAILRKKAEWLMANTKFSIVIEGNCDERGTNEYNLALGERRAITAKNFLVSMGVSMDRVSTISYGEEKPADPGHNDKAWAKNRRDEFKVK
ncbi:MAG: peptidoglycan-associated lipoprotein Pal [Pseudomonadota bacterium]